MGGRAGKGAGRFLNVVGKVGDASSSSEASSSGDGERDAGGMSFGRVDLKSDLRPAIWFIDPKTNEVESMRTSFSLFGSFLHLVQLFRSKIKVLACYQHVRCDGTGTVSEISVFMRTSKQLLHD